MALSDRLRDGISDMIGGAINWTGAVIEDSLTKAARSDVPETKRDGALDLLKYAPDPADDPKPIGQTWDPYAIVNSLGYKDRPMSLSYDVLDLMTKRVPIFAALVHNRVTQLANFATPQENDREPGYQIKLRDEKRSPTKVERQEAASITDWMGTCGSTRKKGKDNFESFLKQTGRDSLIYDQMGFEVIPNRKGLPSDFIAHDARTLRIADIPPGKHLQDDTDEVRYVQVYDEVVISEFTRDQLCFGVRNPRTDLRVNGYGFAEMEMIVSTVTGLLYGFDYNQRYFTQGSQPKGMINFKGQYPDSKIEAFRRMWHAMATGVLRSWRMPITSAEDVQFINFQQSNRDMEWGNYIDLLIKIICAVCQTDPTELNFIYGNSGQTSQLFQAPAENRIKASKDKGLRPLLRSYQHWINEYLIWEINEDYKIVFTGMDARTSDEVTSLQKKQVTYLKTVDEVRAEDDLPPLPDGKGDIILDPTYLQNAQAIDMQNQQEAMPEEGEAEPEEGEPTEGQGEENPGAMEQPEAPTAQAAPQQLQIVAKSFQKRETEPKLIITRN